MQQPWRPQRKMQVVRLVQAVASAALKTSVALEALTAMVPPAFWKITVVLAALVALVVSTPRVALAALLTGVALALLRARVVLTAPVARVTLETRKRWDQQLSVLPVSHGLHILQNQHQCL